MSAAERASGQRSWRGLLLPALLLFAILVALGTWQLQRKTWKEGLIAILTARLAAPPQALPPASAWAGLDQADAEYRRVTFRAAFDDREQALVYATPSAFRPDVSGVGFWLFAPARLSGGGVVVVNRGFVPKDLAATADAAGATPAVEIVGVVRWPDAVHWYTPKADPTHNLWFVRDPAAIAAAKGWTSRGSVAPFYVEQEFPAPEGGFPQPGKLVVRLPDNHLQYAVTWFGLALVLVVVFATWAFKSGREARSRRTL